MLTPNLDRGERDTYPDNAISYGLYPRLCVAINQSGGGGDYRIKLLGTPSLAPTLYEQQPIVVHVGVKPTNTI